METSYNVGNFTVNYQENVTFYMFCGLLYDRIKKIVHIKYELCILLPSGQTISVVNCSTDCYVRSCDISFDPSNHTCCAPEKAW